MVIFCSFHNFELKKQKVILKQIYFRRRVEIFKKSTKSRKSLKEAKKVEKTNHLMRNCSKFYSTLTETQAKDCEKEKLFFK